ncbi:MAG: hypothetical protein JWO83_19 [Caulobacteraceae bacterium]|nr:hypothetical protein [Caulobacteraceae bacterium]
MDTPDQTTRDQTATDQVVRDETPRDPPTRDQAMTDRPPNPGLTTADLARGKAAPQPGAGPGQPGEEQPAALFPAEDARNFQARWDAIQVSFVDEPRRAVEQADALVAEALKRQAEIFAAARADLETQWDRGQDVSTEDLRQALRRYRAFFTRVLKV